ncbi:MAG: glycosyltransferase [Aigarchaeota archaeon]|nr:glycosyltransferase [Candidatus Pelearchaeum maunauluense]
MLFFQVLAALAWLGIALARRRILRMLPQLNVKDESQALPSTVSVIIPARNEEKNIGRCIESIIHQLDEKGEIIVVDDSSTDSTREVVRRYSKHGVKLIEAGELPEGWLGKPWACYLGYTHSSGEWLLFTDADAEFGKGCIRNALITALEHGAELATQYPRMRMRSIWLKAALPILLLALYAFGRPHKVSSGEAAFAFGSFILIRRDVYEKLGGHERVRDAVLEDRAIALLARDARVRTLFLDGTNSMTAEWNNSLKSLWNGMVRLFTTLYIGSSKKSIINAFMLIILFIFPLASLAYSLAYNIPTYILLASLSTVLISYVIGEELRKHRISFIYSVLWPLGVLLILCAVIVSGFKATLRPLFRWRNRLYRVEAYDGRERAVILSA